MNVLFVNYWVRSLAFSKGHSKIFSNFNFCECLLEYKCLGSFIRRWFEKLIIRATLKFFESFLPPSTCCMWMNSASNPYHSQITRILNDKTHYFLPRGSEGSSTDWAKLFCSTLLYKDTLSWLPVTVTLNQ